MIASRPVFLSLRHLLQRAQGQWVEFKGVTPTDRNLFFLCMEIIPIGLASGALSFNGPFVLKLGASNSLIGAMSSLPALMVILFTIPAARFMDRVQDRKPWVTGSLALSRMIYLLIAITPWVLPYDLQAISIVGLVVIQAIPLALFNTAFWVLLAEVCPPDRRSSLFTTRTFLLSATVAISAFLSGVFLDRVAFPLNYQLLNFFGFVMAQLSTYFVNRVTHVVPTEPATAPAVTPAEGNASAPAAKPAPPHKWSWAEIRKFVHENRPFVNFNIVTFICWFGAWGAGPLYTVYLVRMLNLSNSWLGANTTLAQIATVISAPLWNRLIKRKGNLWVVLRTVVLTGLYPWLIVLLPQPAPLLLIGFANTLNDTGIGIAHSGVFLEVIPPKKRNNFIAIHTTLMNIGAMVAPLVAAPLADVISVPLVLIICGIIRFIGGVLFSVIPPRAHATGLDAETPAPIKT